MSNNNVRVVELIDVADALDEMEAITREAEDAAARAELARGMAEAHPEMPAGMAEWFYSR